MTINLPLRRKTLLLAALAVAYLALGGYWTWRAPAGRWTNRIFDFAMWGESDPGEWYIPAAHQFVSQRGRSCFPGHPGLPLVTVLYVEQVVLFSLGRLSGTSADFTPFIAQHTLAVWVVAKLGVVCLHLLSFAALYQFALALSRRTDVALLSAALYATSFPVLYYLNRVSVEPLMNAFFLWTVVCLVKGDEAEPPRWKPLLWMALAGICAASAFFTKIHLMALWPVFGAASIVACLGNAAPVPLRRRLMMVSAYLGALLASGAVYSYFMDWAAFARYWGSFNTQTPTPTIASVPGFFTRMSAGITSSLVNALSQTKLTDLLPACTKSNCFFFFEFLFLVAVVVGLVPVFRQAGRRRRLVCLVLAYCFLVGCIWFYRAGGTDFHGFHYLFPALAAVAPLAVAGIGVVAPGLLDETRSPWRRGLEMCAAVLVLHYGGFFAVADSKRQDHDAYVQAGGPRYFAALRMAEPSQRVAVIGRALQRFHGLSDKLAEEDRRSPLVAALMDKVFVSEEPPSERLAFAKKARRRSVGVVVDFTLANPGPWTLEEWTAMAAQGDAVPLPSGGSVAVGDPEETPESVR